MRTSITAFFLTLVGAAFCVTAALGGADPLCVTEGCNLTHNVKFFGVSLWWFGTFGFLFLAGLLAARQIKLAYVIAGLGVALDCLLLAWLALTLPCINCMIAGLLFALILLALLRAQPEKNQQTKAGRCVLALWLLLFSSCALSATSELLARPWPILGAPDAPVKLFFSPTCPACRETMHAALQNNTSFVAFVPIAENAHDAALLQELRNRLLASKTPEQSLRRFFEEIDTIKPQHKARWNLRFRLYRNMMALYRYNADKVPVTIVEGAAKHPVAHGTGAKRQNAQPLVPLTGAGGFRGCSKTGGQDCE